MSRQTDAPSAVAVVVIREPRSRARGSLRGAHADLGRETAYSSICAFWRKHISVDGHTIVRRWSCPIGSPFLHAARQREASPSEWQLWRYHTKSEPTTVARSYKRRPQHP
jgi:hypothetical protein